MRSTALALIVLSGTALSAQADPPPPPPAPTPNPPVSLNNRTFYYQANVYDPAYAVGKLAVAKDNIVRFYPFAQAHPPTVSKPTTRNFVIYDYHFENKNNAGLSIPVIGGVSIANDELLHVVMEDISEVYLTSAKPNVCAMWNALRGYRIEPGSKVAYTDHAVFSTLSYVAATSQKDHAEAGVGKYFSASGGLYKDSGVSTTAPLISVDGEFFEVADPRTFCTRNGRPVATFQVDLKSFKTLQDLGLPAGALIREVEPTMKVQ